MKNLKNLNKIVLLLCTLSSGIAFSADDACVAFNAAPDATKSAFFPQLKEQHLVVHHDSIASTSPDEYIGGQKALYTELCKTPFHHRDSLRQHGIEIHLVAGSIEQHPHIKKTIKDGFTPRNHNVHKVKWADLPGVGSDGFKSPVIFDLVALSKPRNEQKHGSGSLVLHEFGHAVDFFFMRTGKKKKNISNTKTFKKISKSFDWKIFIPELNLLPAMTFTQKGGLFLSNTDLLLSPENKDKAIAERIEYNKVMTKNNIKNEELRQYNSTNYEESFAELYARWYKDVNTKNEIIKRSPLAAEYLNNLENQRYEYNLESKQPSTARVESTQKFANIQNEPVVLENIIEHKNCELGWVDARSKDLYTGPNGKMDYNNSNTQALLNLLRKKGYRPRTGRISNNQMILFSLRIQLKGDRPERAFDEILSKGMSFLSPSNIISFSIQNGTVAKNNILFEEEKSVRRSSLASDADFILDLVDNKLPECRKN